VVLKEKKTAHRRGEETEMIAQFPVEWAAKKKAECHLGELTLYFTLGEGPWFLPYPIEKKEKNGENSSSSERRGERRGGRAQRLCAKGKEGAEGSVFHVRGKRDRTVCVYLSTPAEKGMREMYQRRR